MTPVDQTVFGDGSGGVEPGNCFAACVASLLDLPIAEVPNFAAEAQWFTVLQAWLKSRGLWAFEWRWSPHHHPGAPDGLHYIASGRGPRGWCHAVVMSEGDIVHDPHPSRAGLDGEPSRYFVFARLT